MPTTNVAEPAPDRGPAALERGGLLDLLPVALAIAGTLLLLGGGGWMVAGSRLAGDQIREEIRQARALLEEKTR